MGFCDTVRFLPRIFRVVVSKILLEELKSWLDFEEPADFAQGGKVGKHSAPGKYTESSRKEEQREDR
jgi:hypothetical protein